MMIVAIITFTKVYNYGNSLQNFALQSILQEKGIHPETLLYSSYSFMVRIKKIKELCGIDSGPIEKRRKRCFDQFDYEYITFSRKNVLKKELKAEKRYDYFIVGSDQVWNANWYKRRMKDIYLLSFTSNEKKIAYSASFGTDCIPVGWREWFKCNLATFKSISVREDTGQQIVYDLIGKSVQRLVDPTLLLSSDKWREIEKPPVKQRNRDYILTYFLGKESEDAQNILKKYENEYEVLILDRYSENIVAGPSEFLWLIDNAKLILTDSFHGCVFSFLFNKPFLVFDRNDDELSMNSRITTFLKLFDLDRKHFENHLAKNIFEHDYNNGYTILKDEIAKAHLFIDNSLEK